MKKKKGTKIQRHYSNSKTKPMCVSLDIINVYDIEKEAKRLGLNRSAVIDRALGIYFGLSHGNIPIIEATEKLIKDWRENEKRRKTRNI
jgi:hypothetical protein